MMARLDVNLGSEVPGTMKINIAIQSLIVAVIAFAISGQLRSTTDNFFLNWSTLRQLADHFKGNQLI